MEDRANIEKMQGWSEGRPVPAARPLTDFAHERVGDDLVLFDGETMQYHTLNGVAERIWRLCDGIASVEMIASASGLPVDVVETTIGELGEASLLQTRASTWAVSMNRRRAAKLIAAGAAGAVGVPVVLSITAPSHQVAASHMCGNINSDCSAQGGVGHHTTQCGNPAQDLYCCSRAATDRYPIWWWDSTCAGIS